MRVLLVANTLPPADLSGVGEQVLQLAGGLEERGHDVRILGRGRGALGRFKLLFPVTIVVPLLRQVARFRPQVVQVHESDGALAALAVKIAGPLLSPKPLLVALLQVSYWRELRAVRPIRSGGRVLGRPGWRERRFRWVKAPLQILLGWLTVWLADRVLAPSATTAAELERDYLAGAVEVVPNACAPRTDATSAGSEGQGAPALAAPVALFVGRLRIRKGLEVAMEALSSLPARSPEIELVIVGDGEHRGRLERTATRLGVGDRVSFLGRRSRAEVDSLMETARVLVVPSLYEGMPLVIVEAMQRGLAVVASAVSGIPEVVVDGDTGWLVPCEDSKALAVALEEAFENPDEARRRGARGRERLRRDFSPARAAERWERAIALETDSNGNGNTAE
ncbi:MAG: glycosyltransferase family 4 protein [Thermoanaerobaculia bacterium]